MKTLHRLAAVLMTLSILITCIPQISVSGASYVDPKLLTHAEAIAETVADFGTSYKFEDGISVSDLRTVMSVVLNNNPEYFHLSAAYQYTYDRKRPEIALEVLLKYKMTPEEYAAAAIEVQTWVNKVVSLTDPSFTEFEYALFFHDYLASNYEYDATEPARDVYSFIKTGTGVCQSYTYVYELLLSAVGIESTFASSDEMNHIWNIVKIDGEWYHVDLTWDDPIGGAPGEAHHDFFLMSDEEIFAKSKKHYGWISYCECGSKDYDDAPIAQAMTSYAYLDGKWYYMTDGDLYATICPDKAGEKVMDLDLRWYVWDSTSYYTDMYSGLIVRDGLLIANTPDAIITIDPVTKSVADIGKYADGDGYIYGFTVDMGDDMIEGADMSTGKILVNVTKDPSVSGSKITVSVSNEFDGKGDANGDGKLNLSDVACILKYIAKWTVDMDVESADMDSNSVVNLMDATAIMKLIAGWSF